MATPQRKPRERANPSTVVVEVLSAVFAPIRLRKIVREACESAGIAQMPEAPISLRVFVEGALFSTLVRHLGVSLALDLNEQIRASLAHAREVRRGEDDEVRETQEVPTSDVHERRPAAEATSGRRVLVVTQASLVVFLLQDVFGDELEVLPVSGEKELGERLARFDGQPLLVVVDRRHPCVGPGVARRLRDHLSNISAVVWWGADVDEEREVEDRLAGGPRFITTGPDLQLADLGPVCLDAARPI